MSKILAFNRINKLSRQNRGKKTLVVVGGCFDILHTGHVKFLEESKKLANYLIIFLESDQTVRKLKGKGRPINAQEKRAKNLIGLDFVDWVILLPPMKNQDYDNLVLSIEPDVIATTQGDENADHKKRTADLVGAKLIFLKKIKGFSTTGLLQRNNVR